MIVRRILVAVDASPGSRFATEATARLAARLRAQLVGLFVEDSRLLRLAESPLAREVDTLTASRRLPESAAARRQLRLQGLRARERLRRAAEREGIPWTFQVARGSVSGEIAGAVQESDIVGLGAIGWSTRPQRSLGRLANALLEQRTGCTLLVPRSLEVEPPIVVLFDGSPAAVRALAIGGQLAASGKTGVGVVRLAVEPGTVEAAVAETLEEPGRAAVVGALDVFDEQRLTRRLRALSPGLLILPLTGEVADRDLLQRLLDRLGCPVLLVS